MWNWGGFELVPLGMEPASDSMIQKLCHDEQSGKKVNQPKLCAIVQSRWHPRVRSSPVTSGMRSGDPGVTVGSRPEVTSEESTDSRSGRSQEMIGSTLIIIA